MVSRAAVARRLRRIAAGLTPAELADSVAGAVLLGILFWNLPMIIAVLDAVLGGAR